MFTAFDNTIDDESMRLGDDLTIIFGIIDRTPGYHRKDYVSDIKLTHKSYIKFKIHRTILIYRHSVHEYLFKKKTLNP